MGDIDCTWDNEGPGLSVAALAFGLRRRWSWARWVDSDDCAPGLEAVPAQPGLAVVVVFTDRGMVHQLQRSGVRVCDVASWAAIPLTAKVMRDAGLPDHAAAFRRWHDVDGDEVLYRAGQNSSDGGTP